MNKFHKNFFFLVTIIFILVFIMPGYQSGNEEVDRTKFAPPGKMVNIGTHSLHLNCTGTGSPTIILEHGVGANSLDWSVIQPVLSQNSKVCAYDRSGYGWSEPAESPRTSKNLAHELDELIAASDLHPPFVLVAHSFGGVVATAYTAQYPDKVAALVLIDAVNPGMFSAHKDLIQRNAVNSKVMVRLLDSLVLFSRVGIIKSLIPMNVVPWTQTPENLPADLEELRRATLSAANHWLTFEAEMEYMEENAENYSAEKLQEIMGDKPVFVFYGSESAPIPFKPTVPENPERVWEKLQYDWKGLSSSEMLFEVKGADHNSLLFNSEDFQPIVSAVSQIQANYGNP